MPDHDEQDQATVARRRAMPTSSSAEATVDAPGQDLTKAHGSEPRAMDDSAPKTREKYGSPADIAAKADAAPEQDDAKDDDKKIAGKSASRKALEKSKNLSAGSTLVVGGHTLIIKEGEATDKGESIEVHKPLKLQVADHEVVLNEGEHKKKGIEAAVEAKLATTAPVTSSAPEPPPSTPSPA